MLTIIVMSVVISFFLCGGFWWYYEEYYDSNTNRLTEPKFFSDHLLAVGVLGIVWYILIC